MKQEFQYSAERDAAARHRDPYRSTDSADPLYSRRSVPQGGNIDFICWHLFHNPGARFSQVLRALCDFNNIKYRSGQYSEYFTSYGQTGRRCVGPTRSLWQKVGPGWMLTLDGIARYGEHCQHVKGKNIAHCHYLDDR